MNSIVRSNVAFTRPSSAKARGALLSLGIALIALIGCLAPAAAGGPGGGYHPEPEIRDHRTKPVVRDHRDGTVTETRDHRTGGASGGVTVGEGKKRPHGVPCLGNLC